jgi:hypothetical protein
VILLRFESGLPYDIFNGFTGDVFSWVGDGDFSFFSGVLKMVMATGGFIKKPTIIIKKLNQFH